MENGRVVKKEKKRGNILARSPVEIKCGSKRGWRGNRGREKISLPRWAARNLYGAEKERKGVNRV